MDIEHQRLTLRRLEFEAKIKDLKIKDLKIKAETNKLKEVKQKKNYTDFESNFSFEKDYNRWLWSTMLLRIPK